MGSADMKTRVGRTRSYKWMELELTAIFSLLTGCAFNHDPQKLHNMNQNDRLDALV